MNFLVILLSHRRQPQVSFSAFFPAKSLQTRSIGWLLPVQLMDFVGYGKSSPLHVQLQSQARFPEGNLL